MRALLLCFVLACGGSQAVDTNQHGPPPPDQEEKVIERPGYAWVHGHWEWKDHQWQWVGGHWKAAGT